jgi:hypothetical protein
VTLIGNKRSTTSPRLRLTQWFGDTTNGIKSFFAERAQTKEFCVDDVASDATKDNPHPGERSPRHRHRLTGIESDEAQNARIKQLAEEVAALKAAAGAATGEETGAPGGLSAPAAGDADTATTTRLAETEASGEAPTTASSTPDTPKPAEADPEVEELEADDLPEPEAVNDNRPADPLPAIGTN